MTQHDMTSLAHDQQVQRMPPASGVGSPVPGAVFDSYLELSSLSDQRRAALKQPAFTLTEHSSIDWRMDSVLDGLRVSGKEGYERMVLALAEPTPERVFVTTVLTLENRNTQRLKQLLVLAEAEPALQTAMLDAFAWVPASFTQQLIPHLLATSSRFCRLAGLHLYRQHQVHADTVLEWAITQPEAELQTMALDAVGEIGLLDLLPRCLQWVNSPDVRIAFAAARACALLGERQHSLARMMQIAQVESDCQREALSLLAALLPVNGAQQFLSTLAKRIADQRLLVQVAGELGDPANIPALLRLMQNPALSRLAGHAFCAITGLDLVEQNMDCPAPETLQSGPTDEAEDSQVESDPDEALPWPDQAKLAQWWAHNGGCFKAGVRYLAGGEITRQYCLQVLQHGFQSQRRCAALYLKAFDPASPLFLLDEPVWRQQKRLAQLLAQG